MNAAPAFQTMNRWKKIHRGIHLINQADQLFTNTVSSDIRSYQCGRKQQEKSQTEQLGDHISVDKLITERLSFPGNQQIIDNPLYIGQKIEKDEWSKKWNPVIHRQSQ